MAESSSKSDVSLASTLDVALIRRDFPILQQHVRSGKPLVYLDSAATSQKPAVVIEALGAYYREINANVHRGIHRLAELATEAYEEARVQVAAFIGAPAPEGVIFTRGTTEGINLVARAWGDAHVQSGDEILVSGMEHHSNLVPWQMLAQRRGASLKIVEVNEDGTLDVHGYHQMLSARTRMVAITHMSNVLGTVNPVRELADAAHRVGALVLVDGAQSVPHMPVQVQELGCDFLAFSGHKMCGPTGIGVLYGRPEILDAMDPFLGGGEMISKVLDDHSTWAGLPNKFEAGTPDISGAIGLGVAVKYLTGLGMARLHAYEVELTGYALRRLGEVPGLTIHGTAPERGGALSFELKGVHPHDIAHFADKDGIAIRAGHMCAQPLMRRRGVGALSRASLYFYTTRDEVDALVANLIRTREYFHRGAG
jgi:cysteine desulfurase/selenocysteine lyase